jgi:hypothetical protein
MLIATTPHIGSCLLKYTEVSEDGDRKKIWQMLTAFATMLSLLV